MKRFRHTDRRMREESAHQARTAQNPEEELAPTNTLMLVATASFRAKETSTSWSSFWMILVMTLTPIQNKRLPSKSRRRRLCHPVSSVLRGSGGEHAARTSLEPITRLSLYSPMMVDSTYFSAGSIGFAEQPASKRQRTEDDQPLSRRVLCAEAMMPLYKRGARLIEVIEWLGLKDEFRRIFFPFEEDFPVSTVFHFYSMERMHNPDGFFRHNPYHLDSMLHNAECNFLQGCAILFRQTKDFELAYTIEEILSTRFRDDSGIMQLLREATSIATMNAPQLFSTTASAPSVTEWRKLRRTTAGATLNAGKGTLRILQASAKLKVQGPQPNPHLAFSQSPGSNSLSLPYAPHLKNLTFIFRFPAAAPDTASCCSPITTLTVFLTTHPSTYLASGSLLMFPTTLSAPVHIDPCTTSTFSVLPSPSSTLVRSTQASSPLIYNHPVNSMLGGKPHEAASFSLFIVSAGARQLGSSLEDYEETLDAKTGRVLRTDHGKMARSRAVKVSEPGSA
ncbi:hypothetical protein B0H17DRAFT_1147972 [Mycena rosella]|uniref:Uncharacterized protein n=1 Tax=Mycena rosella TaxID=1033263 RepID=A0AAD7CH19_MYCRO|nr:hypothetical protein B0H17DRAFT_1147972 [Mycena rosella]